MSSCSVKNNEKRGTYVDVAMQEKDDYLVGVIVQVFPWVSIPNCAPGESGVIITL